MSWDSFIYFAIAAIILWSAGALTAFKGEKKTIPSLLTALGLAVFFVFILGLWVSLERPPLRTMGETRLWYSLFLPLAGLYPTAVGVTAGYCRSPRCSPWCSSS